MGLISTEVEVILNGQMIKHYENLGYEIPRYKNVKNKLVVKKGTKIIVNISDLPKNSNVYVDVKCDCCNKKYSMKYTTYNKHNHDLKIYCFDCAMKIFNSGENNKRWNPNKTHEERENSRDYPEYTDFIKRVMARDKYTCICCGQKHGDLEVHHLDGYNWCKEKRIDDTSAVTLCHNCHYNFHLNNKFGDNTKEQFLDWLENAKLELSNYDGKLPTSREVIRLDDHKVYKNFKYAGKDVNSKSDVKICSCCNYFKNPELKHTERNAYGYTYMWLDEYNELTKEDVEKYYKECVNHRRKVKEIICITTNEYFKTAKDANVFYSRDKDSSKFTDCCKGKAKTSGVKDGKKLKWMYYDEYSKLVNNEYIGNFVI